MIVFRQKILLNWELMLQSFDKISFCFILMSNIENCNLCHLKWIRKLCNLCHLKWILLYMCPSSTKCPGCWSRENLVSLSVCSNMQFPLLLFTYLFVLACACLLNYLLKYVHVYYLNYDQFPQWAGWSSVLLLFQSGFLEDFALLCALIIHVVIS